MVIFFQIRKAMIRSASFLFLLFGLALLDWSCCGGFSDRPSTTATLENLDYVYSYTSDSTLVNHERHAFTLFGDVKFVKNEPSFGFGQTAYACSPAFESFPFISFHSMRVFCDKPYSEQADTNLTLLFLESENSLFEVGADLAQQDSFHTHLQLPPSQADSFQFTIQLLDFDGRIMETTTDRIFVSP